MKVRGIDNTLRQIKNLLFLIITADLYKNKFFFDS